MKNYFVLFIILIVSSGLAFTQSFNGNTMSTEKIFQDDMQNKLMSEQALKSESFIYGNIIKPEYYYLGPGDILSYQNLAYNTSIEYISITPENTLFIPRIGMISVDGLTLAQAKDSILKQCNIRNKNSNVFISLIKPRIVMVNVTGNVLFPGTYTIPSTFRVSTAINMANQYNNKQNITIPQSFGIMSYQEKQKDKTRTYSNAGIATINSYSSRNIKVIHNNGTSSIVDLEKANAINDVSFDPFVREKDEIFVPFNSDNNPMISISGAVVRPSVVSYKNGDKVSLLLKLGYGLTDDADLENVYLLIPGDVGDNKKIKLNINKDMLYTGEDYELTPGSSIVVGFSKEEKHIKQGVVSVIGNVKSEGIYLINNNTTKLSEVISNAGGFTDNAYLPLAYILRREQRDYSINDPRKQYNEEFLNSDLTMEDTTRYILQQNLRKPYVSCDFHSLFLKGDKSQDAKLTDGDIIYVPSNPRTIYVYGQVKSPGYQEFEENKPMEYYINKAGGFTGNADKSRSRIIRGRFKTWVEGDDDVFLFAGDEIYVPNPPDLPPGLETQQYAAYAGIAAAIAGVINIFYLLIFVYKN